MKRKLYGKIKYMALFLAVTVFVMGFSMYTVMGDTTARIFGGDETTTAGSIVTLPLSIENNPGIAAFVLELSYNKDVLTFVNATPSANSSFEDEAWLFEVYGDCFVWSNDTDDSMNPNRYNTDAEGVMFDLVFEVADDAEAGIYPVEIQLKDAEPGNMSDCEGKPVEVTFERGIIRIEDASGQRTITNVTLDSPADKLEYWTGETFDITGATLKVEYSDSTFDYVTVTEGMLEAIPDTDTVGTKEVQIKYQNWEYINDLTFDIVVKDPTISNVTLDSPADKLDYWTGETFDVTGAKLKVEWTNGDTTYVDVTESMLEAIPDTSVAGTKTVQVVYQGWEDINDLTFDIEVVAPELENVTLESPADKLLYWTDETFDVTGAKLKLEWTNSDTTYVDVTDAMLEAIPDTSVAGTKTVQVVYQGWEDINDLTFDIEVVAPEIENVTLASPADKLVYMIGETFDVTGAQLKVEWTNGNTTYVDVTDAMLEAIPDTSVAGTKTVQVVYQGWEDINDLTFDIEVKAADVTIQNVTLHSPADKISYTTGEEFDITGAKLEIEWSDGSKTYVDVTDAMLEAIPDTSTAGTKTVQIVYQGWEDINDLTFEIEVTETVTENKIVSAEMSPAPTKKVYNVGDKFTAEGGKIKLTYENGDVVYIDITEDMCSGYDMDVAGEYEVTVSYGDFEFTYVILVNTVENPSSGDFNLMIPFVGMVLAAAFVLVSIYMKKKKS